MVISGGRAVLEAPLAPERIGIAPEIAAASERQLPSRCEIDDVLSVDAAHFLLASGFAAAGELAVHETKIFVGLAVDPARVRSRRDEMTLDEATRPLEASAGGRRGDVKLVERRGLRGAVGGL